MANDRHPVHVTIFDRSGRRKITAYADSMRGWPNEESVTDYVTSYPAKKYTDHSVEVDDGSLAWRFQTGRVAGQTSVRLLRKPRKSTPPKASLHHATKKKSSAQLDREIEAFLQGRVHAPNMPHTIPDRGYMVAQHGGGTYLSSFGSKDEAVRFARGLAKRTREGYDIVKVQNRGEDRFIVDKVTPPTSSVPQHTAMKTGSHHAKMGRHGYDNGQRVVVLDYLGDPIGTGRVRSGDNYAESDEYFTWVTMTRDGETVTEQWPTRRVVLAR